MKIIGGIESIEEGEGERNSAESHRARVSSGNGSQIGATEVRLRMKISFSGSGFTQILISYYFSHNCNENKKYIILNL